MKRLVARGGLIVLLCLGGLAAALSAAGLLYRPNLDIPSGFAGTHVEVGGVLLRVLQEGAGRDILMIHGSPGVLEDFDAQARELQRSFRVTRYDRPGHGFSGDSGSYSFDDNARIALALVEKLGLTRTVVVGHSYGGAIALALAEKKPPQVAALVVLDSAVYAPIRPVNPLFRYLRLPALGLGLARVAPRSGTEARVRESIAAEFKAGPPPQDFVDRRVAVFAEPKVVHAIANEHSSSAENLAHQSPSYGTIGVPVYIVAQRDDPARSATAERLHAQVQGSDILLLSPSGHYVHVEQAAAVTELIRRAAGS